MFDTTLNEEVMAVIQRFLDLGFCLSMEWRESNLELTLADNICSRLTLILHNANELSADPSGYALTESEFITTPEGDSYSFVGKLMDWETWETSPYTITFKSADIKLEIFNAVSGVFYWLNPWNALHQIASSLLLKADLPGKPYNDQELALLPLMREITSLFGFPMQASFPLLMESAKRHGLKSAVKSLKIRESKQPDDCSHMVQRSIALLCRKENEPMWREIFNAVQASQKDYPSRTEVSCPPALLYDIRNKIQAFMTTHGYCGTYPDFFKTSLIRGIHEVVSYDRSYTIIGKNHAHHHIRCVESVVGDTHLNVRFLCGTAFLKKNAPEIDVYSCAFNANGRRFFYTINCSPCADDYRDIKPVPLTLEQGMNIAVKKTELVKLTKEERELCYGSFKPNWRRLWIFLLFGGCIFSTIFISAMFLFTGLLMGDLRENLTIFPWLRYFIFTWVAFGGFTGVLAILSTRPK